MLEKWRYELDASPHPTLPDHYCVPLTVWPDNPTAQYRIYLNSTNARFYSEADLPDFIKAQLGMIKARKLYHPLAPDAMVDYISMYRNHMDPEVPALGWRLSLLCFVLVLTKEQLRILDTGEKGESNYGQEQT